VLLAESVVNVVEVEAQLLYLVLRVGKVEGSLEVKNFGEDLSFDLVGGGLLELFSFVLAQLGVEEKDRVTRALNRSNGGLLGGFTFARLRHFKFFFYYFNL
jgi:hypothetical protein